jgi:hypothetical protein
MHAAKMLLTEKFPAAQTQAARVASCMTLIANKKTIDLQWIPVPTLIFRT